MNRNLTYLTIGFTVLLFALSPLFLGTTFASSGKTVANQVRPNIPIVAGAISPKAMVDLGMKLPATQHVAPSGTFTYLCSTPVDYYGDYPTPGAEVANTVGPASGGVFVLSWGTGNIYYCNKGVATLVTTGTLAGTGSFGLAMVGGTAYVTQYSGLLETCTGITTASGSGTCTTSSIDSTYCSSLPAGFCNADGDAVVSTTLYFADVVNGVVATCNLSASSCSTQYSFGGYYASPYGYPVNIAFSSGKEYVVNDDCASTSGSQVWVNGANVAAYDFNCDYASGQVYDYFSAEGLMIGPAHTALSGNVLVTQYVYDDNTGAENYIIQDLTTSNNATTVKYVPTAVSGVEWSNINICALGKTIVYSDWLYGGTVFASTAKTATWTL